ncbi:MAG TPA: MopE-related protein, partial [Myxococcota bacterium]|nr:MopE-related protein [Myxococcota bacterium]
VGFDAEPAWRWSDVRAPDVDPCDGWDAELSPDVDGDGLPDLVISGREAVHVLPGGPGGPGATPLWVGGGEPGCWGTGATACEIPVLRGVGVGDINGDGHGDVAVVEAHALRVHLGRPGGVSDEPLWVFPDDHGPLDVARVGDRDGDGIDELLVLTPFEVSGNQYVGAARLYDGRPETDLDLDGVANELDCAPYDPDVHPGAAEIGGGHVDEDCDGAFGCFADADGDGAAGTLVGVPLATPSCASAGLSDALTDCVDDDPASLAFGPEVADNDVDEDCDGRLACRLDLDGDGAGGPSPVLLDGPSCLADPRHDADLADCDDGDPDIGPGAAEVAGGVVDEDCDGTVDCYVDGDGDGVGQAVAVVASPDMTCDHVGMSPRGSDCDDHNPTVSPDAAVVANDLIDQDCSGAIECWRDADGDGWGGAPIDYPGRATCVGVSGTAQRGGDCDDGNYRTWPGAPELEDGLDAAQADNNCDGAVGCLRDEDGDRWGGQEIVWFSVTPGAWSQCTQRLGLVTRGGDCDDHDAAISPAANENVVTPGDEDCDGVEWCCDFDVDGDGQDARSVCTPTAMTGGRVCPTTPATTDPRDCDDHDPTVFAGAVEIPGDGVDQDCDDALDCFADDDGDSYVGARVYQEMLDAWCTLDDPCIVDTDGDGDFDLLVRDPLRPVSQCPYDLGPDCDDGDPDVNPGAPDLGGDRVDGDCDGPDGLGLTAWFTAPNANFRVEPVYPQDDLLVFVSLVGPGRGPCPASIQRSCLSLLQPQLVVR